MAREILFQELEYLLGKREIVLFDIRSPEDVEEDGAYPNSINVSSVGEVVQALNMSKQQFLAKYCVPKPDCDCAIAFADDANGRVAQRAAQRAISSGYTKFAYIAMVLMAGWKTAVKEENTTTVVAIK